MSQHAFKTLLLGITAACAAAPSLTSAAAPAPTPGLTPCVSAFMQSLARRSSPLRLREAHMLNGGLSEAASGELVLTATDARDNRTLGRAICRINAQGELVHFEALPPNALLPL